MDFAPVAPLFQTDAYKLGHLQQYGLAGEVTGVYSNYTNRGSRIPDIGAVVHFGLQAFLDTYADSFRVFFDADEDLVCAAYEARLTGILGPNRIGSAHVRALHRLGFLPLRFCAVPEGTAVPLRIPSFTIENTHPDFFWLTNYIETVLSAQIWQASTTATVARAMRETLEGAAERTGTPAAAVDWQGHDFSYRGMSSNETAAMSGAAHLLSFTGTDSLVAIDWIERHYGGEFIAGSVPATEHSVMCAGIATVGERELFERLLGLYPSGIVSVVSDTFDLWRVLTEYLPALKREVLARDGKLVIRPDSGDPVDILCGVEDNPDAKPAERKGVIELLWDTFGGTVNAAGFKELDTHIGAIYGDSITRERAVRITERLAAKGFASGNVVFGMGSFGYQFQTRDTFMSAIKATWIRVDGRGVDIRKDPVTDSGTKKSATGRLAVVRDPEGQMRLIERATPAEEAESLLQPAWEDGGVPSTPELPGDSCGALPADGAALSEAYDQPLVAMDALPVRYREERLEFGLAPREYSPHEGVEALPGVLLLAGEHGSAPVLRALRTKAGIPETEVRLTRQLGWFDGTMRDPRSATISLASLVFLEGDARDGKLRWHPLDDVPPLPFDHTVIVRSARVRLGEIVWRDWDVTRALLGEKFTSGNALALGAALQAEPFDRPNFRRWLEGTGAVRVTTDTTGVKLRGRTTVWEWND